MIEYTTIGDAISFRVYVIPRASRTEIVGEHNGALRVRLAAPPVNGAANDELVRTLARLLKLPQSSIEIVAGRSSRTKQLRVKGARADLLKILE
jgi:uncharacterized protein